MADTITTRTLTDNAGTRLTVVENLTDPTKSYSELLPQGADKPIRGTLEQGRALMDKMMEGATLRGHQAPPAGQGGHFHQQTTTDGHATDNRHYHYDLPHHLPKEFGADPAARESMPRDSDPNLLRDRNGKKIPPFPSIGVIGPDGRVIRGNDPLGPAPFPETIPRRDFTPPLSPGWPDFGRSIQLFPPRLDGDRLDVRPVPEGEPMSLAPGDTPDAARLAALAAKKGGTEIT